MATRCGFCTLALRGAAVRADARADFAGARRADFALARAVDLRADFFFADERVRAIRCPPLRVAGASCGQRVTRVAMTDAADNLVSARRVRPSSAGTRRG